jgi:hypothetical protein
MTVKATVNARTLRATLAINSTSVATSVAATMALIDQVGDTFWSDLVLYERTGSR